MYIALVQFSLPVSVIISFVAVLVSVTINENFD